MKNGDTQGAQQPATATAKKKYNKPAFEFEQVFETTALICAGTAKTNSGGGRCTNVNS